jgi:hypothetical protein
MLDSQRFGSVEPRAVDPHCFDADPDPDPVQNLDAFPSFLRFFLSLLIVEL